MLMSAFSSTSGSPLYPSSCSLSTQARTRVHKSPMNERHHVASSSKDKMEGVTWQDVDMGRWSEDAAYCWVVWARWGHTWNGTQSPHTSQNRMIRAPIVTFWIPKEFLIFPRASTFPPAWGTMSRVQQVPVPSWEQSTCTLDGVPSTRCYWGARWIELEVLLCKGKCHVDLFVSITD